MTDWPLAPPVAQLKPGLEHHQSARLSAWLVAVKLVLQEMLLAPVSAADLAFGRREAGHLAELAEQLQDCRKGQLATGLALGLPSHLLTQQRGD